VIHLHENPSLHSPNGPLLSRRGLLENLQNRFHDRGDRDNQANKSDRYADCENSPARTGIFHLGPVRFNQETCFTNTASSINDVIAASNAEIDRIGGPHSRF
jgi:hypothetical protein